MYEIRFFSQINQIDCLVIFTCYNISEISRKKAAWALVPRIWEVIWYNV